MRALDIINMMRARGRGDPPSALADVFVNPLVRVINYLNGKIDFARTEGTVDNIVVLLESPAVIDQAAVLFGETSAAITARLKSALNDIASNFGIFRRPALPSSGSALFMRAADPSTALPIAVTGGVRLYAPSTNQTYVVSNTVIVDTMSFDATYNKFVASIPIHSLGVGLTANAPVETIIQLKSTVPGIDSIINPTVTTGGADEETDRNLATRIKTALSANNIGTQSGYTNVMLQIPELKDAMVVGAGDPLMNRDLGDGGAVDIYVVDAIPLTINQLATSDNTVDLGGGHWKFTPTSQPVINDANAVVPAGNVVGIVKDTGIYAGSMRAKDYIVFDTDPTALGYNVQFQVNTLVSIGQNYINDPSRKVLGADILIKEGVYVGVDVIFQMIVLSGFNFSVVKPEVEAAISQFISGLTIGDSLQLSDVIKVITEISGVDQVIIPLQKFNRQTLAADPALNTITAYGNEILRPNVIKAQQ